jgi:hypothetical protein
MTTDDIRRQVDGIMSFLDHHAKEFEPFMRQFFADARSESNHRPHDAGAEPNQRERLLILAILLIRGCPTDGLESATDWLWQHQPTSVDDLLGMVDEAVGLGSSMTNQDSDSDGHQ